METIKVNMTPNPLDVQTIHASQNDGEARQWEFELHNNGELIDTSEVTEQMVFKSYKGGTEQILPENGSTPTTSPFLGNIKYPQGLLADQSFTYRQSPTEEDGLAKITDIKGNTLVWNQKLNVGTLNATQGIDQQLNIASAFNFVANHKYLLIWNQKVTMGSNTRNTPLFNDGTTQYLARDTANYNLEKGVKSWLFTTSNTTNNGFIRLWVHTPNVDVPFTDFMLFDLTQMGLDISSPSDFTSLFPLPYYAYNQGTLLSFNGNGIKTVGKNLYNLEDVYESVAQLTVEGNKLTIVGTVRPSARFILPSLIASGKLGKTFTLSWNLESLALTAPAIFCGFIIRKADNTLRYVSNGNKAYGRKTISVTLADGETIERVDFNGNDSGTNYGTQTMVVSDIQLEIGSTATSFEPYTESVLSLPISTYFPNGMKSAGTVYDELTPTKGITRIGAVDLGSLTWVYSNSRFLTDSVSTKAKGITNLKCAIYETSPSGSASGMADKTIKGQSDNARILVHDSAYTDVTTFTQAMSGVYLYYELATPTETSFTTASLVTENAEIPLSNEDGVLIGKCTEQLSSESGFFDAKIKLADEDGECYSNKIQLHIERSPQ